MKVGEEVQVNQTLGFLKPVPASEFPPINWTIYESFFFRGQIPVSLYDYCNNLAQEIMMDLCLSFGKMPEDSL